MAIMRTPRLAGACVALLAALPSGGAQCPPTHPCAGGAHITVNPLRGLPPLPKPHWSWPIPKQYVTNDSVADDVVADYVRITGGLSHNFYDLPSARVAVQICSKAARMPGGHGPRAPSIGLNFGCIPGCYGVDAANATCEAAGMAKFNASLRASVDALAAANREAGTSVRVGAVMIDCESDVWWENSSPAHVAGVTRRNELLYNATREVLADKGTLVLFYAYGAAEWVPDRPEANCTVHARAVSARLALPRGWCIRPAFTYGEHWGDVPLSPPLYMLPEPVLTREQFRHTAQAAASRGGAWARGGALAPYISLGLGYRRNSTDLRHPEKYSTFDNWYRYDEAYSALLGAQMHRRRFEASAWGPWERALGGVLFPSPFDEWNWAGFPSAHTKGSSHSMDHFIAYVKGAQEDE